MKLSQALLVTLREDPKEAEVISYYYVLVILSL